MWQFVDLGAAGQQMRSHPEVSQVAGARSPEGTLYVLVEQQGFVYGTVLRDIVLDELGTAERDVVVAVVRAVPLTTGGAIDPMAAVSLARQVASEGRWTFAIEPAATDAERAIAALLSEMLSLRRLSMTDSLPLLGADSLVLVELSAAITERFGVTVMAMDLFDVDTVRELAHLVFGPDETPA